MIGVIPYPAAKRLTADVLASAGGLEIGCYSENGSIYPALSPEKVAQNCPAGVFFGTAVQPSGRLIVCNSEGFHYSTDGITFVKSDSGVTARRPFAFSPNGTETCIAGDTEVLVTGEATSSKKPFNGNIYGGVFKNGRLFGIDRNNAYTIRWSGAGGLDFTDKIDGAGWLEINVDRGKILGLAVYDQNIVALCEYGLVRLSAFGMPENFKLQYIDGATGKIYKNTAAVAGGKLVFFTEHGAVTFDGSGVDNAGIPLFSDAQNPVCAVGSGDLYFLSAYSKKLKRKVIFVADISNGSAYIADAEASAMPVSDKVHCISDGGHYVLKIGGEYTFESAEFDFGTRREKYLKSIRLGTSEAVEVTVKSGGISHIFGGVKGYLRPYMRGRSFKIIIRGNCKITGITAEAEVWNGI